MEPKEIDHNSLRGHASHEDLGRPNRAVEALRHRQRGRTPSLLLSPPETSPLITLDDVRQGSSRDLPQLNNPAQPHEDRFTGSSEPGSFYDPSREALIRLESDLNRCYRERWMQYYNAGERGRCRSRSPRRSDQISRLPEGQEVRMSPWVAVNDFPREPYVPPQLAVLSSPPHTYAPSDNENGHARPMELEDASHPFNQVSPLEIHHSQGLVRKSESPDAQETPQKGNTKPEEGQLCEFAAPCQMHPSPDGMHYRKVVSHVFGRNKAVTKLFPLGVWVHYCRKHYQRARYRADQWPFTQCDLLSESLDRMERWNGVLHFELILRRREQLRVEHDSEARLAEDEDDQRATTANGHVHPMAKKPRTPGGRCRKHPTSIVAPVPNWLRRHVGDGKSFDEIRRIIELIRRYMTQLRDQEIADSKEIEESSSYPTTPRSGLSSNRRKGGRKADLADRHPLRQRASSVRFPDIEILPHFKPWVKEAALRQRAATSSGSQDAGTGERATPAAPRGDHGDDYGDGGSSKPGTRPVAARWMERTMPRAVPMRTRIPRALDTNGLRTTRLPTGLVGSLRQGSSSRPASAGLAPTGVSPRASGVGVRGSI
ncbi:uncharacterized protein N7515_008338 [Penicillium bovifimosum]|uniref:Uncharacterized protein n=1 Tax=Penicillium bovifimosum TaxID=126998 RepID=A0A9W9GN30_9EURO|nr:uncharacterized protein N7515_008338 [Penicillium bovifimosum]KAJ5124513.1 hypothetical protein N7515_008338 [Penicillium bovifimosum]